MILNISEHSAYAAIVKWKEELQELQDRTTTIALIILKKKQTNKKLPLATKKYTQTRFF